MQLYIMPDTMKNCPKDFAVIDLKEQPQYQISAGPSLLSAELLFQNKDQTVSYCFRKLTHIGPEEYQLLERMKWGKKYTPISQKCLMLIRKKKKGELLFPFWDARYVYTLTGNPADLAFTLFYRGEAMGTVKKDKATFTVKYKEKDEKTGEEQEKEKQEEKETFILETETDAGMPFFAAAVVFINFICHGSFT